jgi:hypothetical protein
MCVLERWALERCALERRALERCDAKPESDVVFISYCPSI